MPLSSKLFRGNPKLEACLISDPAHIMLGAQGEHVAKIQQALVVLGAGTISESEIYRSHYGSSTAAAVLAFKGPPRNIINGTYLKPVREPDGIRSWTRVD